MKNIPGIGLNPKLPERNLLRSILDVQIRPEGEAAPDIFARWKMRSTSERTNRLIESQMKAAQRILKVGLRGFGMSSVERQRSAARAVPTDVKIDGNINIRGGNH